MPPEGASSTNSSLPSLLGLNVTSESLGILVLFFESGFARWKMGARRFEARRNLLSGLYTR